MIRRLACYLIGHRPRRLNGTFYIVCDRCPKVINFRTSTVTHRG